MEFETQFFCIRGYMKSGTNWLCRILNCHEQIQCIGEFHWETFYHAFEHNVQRIAPKRRAELEAIVTAQLSQFVQGCLIELSPKPTQWIGDRTPTTIAPIVMPNAPHFVIVRDVRDVLVSRMFHLYNHPRVTTVFDRFANMREQLTNFQKNPWHFHEHPEQLLIEESVVRDSVREWQTFYESDRQTISANPDLPVKTIQYEQLHRDFNAQIASIFEFLSLETPLIPEELTPGHSTESPNSLNRKGQIGDWKNYFHDEAMNWLKGEVKSQYLND